MVDQVETKGKALPARNARLARRARSAREPRRDAETRAGERRISAGPSGGAVQETQVGGDLVAGEDASASPANNPAATAAAASSNAPCEPIASLNAEAGRGAGPQVMLHTGASHPSIETAHPRRAP